MTKKKFEFTHKVAAQLLKKKSVQDFLKLLEHNKPYNSTKFKRMRRRWGCNAEVYINEQEQIVIKLGGTFDLSYIPTRAIPTAYFYDSDLDEDECIRIQPLADVSEKVRDKAYNYIEKVIGFDSDLVGCDCHEGNVGKYKNRYVVIDW